MPEPGQVALLTGLLELIAADAPPADRLAGAAAAQVAGTVGDGCVISLLAGRVLQPVGAADADPAANALLAPLVGAPVAPGGRPELGPYAARFGLVEEAGFPLRSRGRVTGELIALRRGDSPAFSALERQVLQAVGDLVALGLDERRLAALGPQAPTPDKLSRREREVLALLALGHTNREIAEQIHLSIRTVEWHRARIQAKLRLTGRAALAQFARKHGLLSGLEPDHEAE